MFWERSIESTSKHFFDFFAFWLLACGRDGTVRLWDCASLSCISCWTGGEGIFGEQINDVTVISGCNEVADYTSCGVGTDRFEQDPREVGTSGKIAVAATSSGFLRGFDIRAKREVRRS
jgi:hypothetical protein